MHEQLIPRTLFAILLPTALLLSSVVAGWVQLLLPLVLVIPLSYLVRANDFASHRRAAWSSAAKPEWYHPHHSHTYTESYFCNSRSMNLMSFVAWPCSVNHPQPKALVVFCHGFLDAACWYKGCMYREKLLNSGYVMCALEAEGHGRSDGLNGLIKDWSLVIKDFADFTRHTIQSLPEPPRKVFLVGESMGGAVALDLSTQFPLLFNGGVILVSPMVGIHESMMPSPLVLRIFRMVSELRIIGALPIAPTADQGENYYKLPHLREVALSSPSNFGRKPRLASARELLNTTERLLKEVLPVYSRPFLVLHGEDDKITDPEFSRKLYNDAASLDKTIKLIPSAWHVLTTGEPPEVTDAVFSYMIQWLDDRV